MSGEDWNSALTDRAAVLVQLLQMQEKKDAERTTRIKWTKTRIARLQAELEKLAEEVDKL